MICVGAAAVTLIVRSGYRSCYTNRQNLSVSVAPDASCIEGGRGSGCCRVGQNPEVPHRRCGCLSDATSGRGPRAVLGPSGLRTRDRSQHHLSTCHAYFRAAA